MDGTSGSTHEAKVHIFSDSVVSRQRIHGGTLESLHKPNRGNNEISIPYSKTLDNQTCGTSILVTLRAVLVRKMMEFVARAGSDPSQRTCPDKPGCSCFLGSGSEQSWKDDTKHQTNLLQL